MARHGIAARSGLAFPRLHATKAVHGRLSPATLIRLLVPGLLAAHYDRVLYLDADTEICGDVAPLFGLDLAGRPLAAAPAGRSTERLSPDEIQRRAAHFHALGMTEPFRYFNDGVMLIDVARWNAERIGERALEFIERNPALCRLPDEDALNALLDGQIADISPVWNFRADMMLAPRGEELVAPVIRHYDGLHKPWKRFGHNRRLFAFADAYRRYRRFVSGTAWQDWLDRQWSLRDLRGSLAYETRILLDRLRGRRTPGVPTRGRQRRDWNHWRRELAKAEFADVAQGIAIRSGDRLMLNPARARP
jgi:lipopolysaccharide biosynthesis glycosyltransferase